MLPKEFSTPSRHTPSESCYLNDDSYHSCNYQNNLLNSGQGSAKKKAHHPLTVSSSRFQAKGTIPTPFFQDFTTGTYDSTDVTHSCVASEPINAPYYCPIIEHLDLNSFKTKLCTSTAQHNHKHCPFYHNAKDHKRPGFFYSAELCEFAEKEGMTCPNGDMCMKAHNRVEQLYRPEKYKTKFCTFYPHSLEKCDYGTFCSFAHNENDITIELIHNYDYDDDFYMFHFKTVWCPFNLTQHDKALCVYAHNWQDYRRKPNVCAYEPNPCLNWKSTDFILNYEDGCPNREKCSKCHGWKEQEYHPLNYKVKSCPSGKNCTKGRDCPHFHNSKERRVVAANISNKVFRYVPRNRIITNTFKVRSEDRMLNYSSGNSSLYSTAPSLNAYPSMGFSHEGDSFFDPNSNVQQDPFGNNQMMSGNLLTPLSEIPVRHFESLRNQENEEVYGTRPRKQSYDFETVHSKPNGNTLIGMPKIENYSSPFDPNKQEKSGKLRRWSTHDESLGQDSDRLFREIVLSSDKAESLDSPLIRNFGGFGGKENRGLSELGVLRENLVMSKILESENN